MNPNADEIFRAKRVLADAGYLCVHIDEMASWNIDEADIRAAIGAAGIAVECDPQDAEQQMLAIKRGYGIKC